MASVSTSASNPGHRYIITVVYHSQHDFIIQGYAYAVYQYKTLTVGDVTWVL